MRHYQALGSRSHQAGCGLLGHQHGRALGPRAIPCQTYRSGGRGVSAGLSMPVEGCAGTDACRGCYEMACDVFSWCREAADPSQSRHFLASIAELIWGSPKYRMIVEPRPETVHEGLFALMYPDYRRQVPFLFGRTAKDAYGISRAVVDFYSPDNHFAIEIDGPDHDDPRTRERDRIRTSLLGRRYGVRVVRYRNSDVKRDFFSFLMALGPSGRLKEIQDGLQPLIRRYAMGEGVC